MHAGESASSRRGGANSRYRIGRGRRHAPAGDVGKLEIGRRFGERLSVALAACDILDSHHADITYFYLSRLPGEARAVEDRHFPPVEPRTLHLTVEMRL
jgi:hypothetical protein